MEIVDIQKARAALSRLIEKACMGQKVVIRDGKDRLVQLVPIRVRNGRRRLGALKGKLVVGREFFEPLPPGECEDSCNLEFKTVTPSEGPNVMDEST